MAEELRPSKARVSGVQVDHERKIRHRVNIPSFCAIPKLRFAVSTILGRTDTVRLVEAIFVNWIIAAPFSIS